MLDKNLKNRGDCRVLQGWKGRGELEQEDNAKRRDEMRDVSEEEPGKKGSIACRDLGEIEGETLKRERAVRAGETRLGGSGMEGSDGEKGTNGHEGDGRVVHDLDSRTKFRQALVVADLPVQVSGDGLKSFGNRNSEGRKEGGSVPGLSASDFSRTTMMDKDAHAAFRVALEGYSPLPYSL